MEIWSLKVKILFVFLRDEPRVVTQRLFDF
jgi:hypothetical protein